jgi:flavin reductase (DIM6/NTAB) family NADH-FMN oxidoreductase RutF
MSEGLPIISGLPSVDPEVFRSALGQFATGVTIITTIAPDGKPVGFTANSFNSVSLDPPLVLWSLGLAASSMAWFTGANHYAVNVLASEQLELSRRFASRGVTAGERFDGVSWRTGQTGAPLLEGTCAWFECSNRSRYQEGDHVIFVGAVEHLGYANREPLIFQNGTYHMTQPHPGIDSQN